jgi:uncharacterized protein with GYD domain
MAKYLIQGTYVGTGVAGLLQEGGSGRRTAIEQALQALGGRVEAMYYAFGGTDVFVIVDLPDHISAVTGSLVANATGTVKVNYTPLLTPEEVDQAAEKGRSMVAAYRSPGAS